MKKFLSIFLACLVFFICTTPAFAMSVYESNLIPTGSVRMTAHRGYSAIAPENTLPAFRLAGEYGFRGAECDTSHTADGVWIIMHDDTVDRTTDGNGKVSNLTYAEIGNLTIDSGNNVDNYSGTKVPTLTEYLDVCKEYGLHPVIEIKTCAPVENMDALTPTAPEVDWTPKEFFMRKLRDCCYQVVAKLEYLFTCPTSDLCR